MKLDLNFFTTIVIPVVSIVVTVSIYFKQKVKKQIACKIISSKSLNVTSESHARQGIIDMEIIIEYINTGNTALESSDFYTPIETDFLKGKIVIVKEYFSKYSDNINLKAEINASNCNFTPSLLNPGESIFLYYHITEFHNSIHISSRIKNGRPVYNKVYEENLKEKISLVFVLYLIGLIINLYRTGNLLFIDSAFTLLVFGGGFSFWFIKDYKNIKRTQYM
jgi:hypothetical protein